MASVLKDKLLAEQHAYLETHPEIKQILHDFVTACLLHKPQDIKTFARSHFAQFLPDGGMAHAASALHHQQLQVLEQQEEVSQQQAQAQPETEAVSSADAAQDDQSSAAASPIADGPRPLVVVGPSGVGKGTLLRRILEEFSDLFGSAVSHTTRSPRNGEVNGVHYHFTTLEQMQQEIDQGLFIEYAKVHTNMYGKSKKSVQDVQHAGKICLLELDVQGAETIKTTNLAPFYLFISPPSLTDLENRLRGRGTESDEQIAVRMGNAALEMAYLDKPGFFDAVLINDDLEVSYTQLKKQLADFFPQFAERLLA